MVGALHRWYHQHARPLPWRETNDPYALWLSEIMLQQTQVGTVIAYYERFLMRFPAVQALADAPLEDVLKSWEGLGYYSRARNLHAAAGLMAQGGFPKTAEAWAALPGVGRSTAGALASFTVGEAAPVLDGNVQRVLCRLFSLDIPLPASGRELKELWSLAGELIRHGDPATHNQAMMELGATVCLPKNPQCPVCPLKKHCRALAQGRQLALPVSRPKAARKKVEVAVGLLVHGQKLLITRRPPEGLLGGLWELPGGKVMAGETPAQAVVREFAEETGLCVAVTESLGLVRHEYTHISLKLHSFMLQKTGGRLSAEARARHAAWVPPGQLGDYAFPTATYKVFRKAGW